MEADYFTNRQLKLCNTISSWREKTMMQKRKKQGRHIQEKQRSEWWFLNHLCICIQMKHCFKQRKGCLLSVCFCCPVHCCCISRATDFTSVLTLSLPQRMSVSLAWFITNDAVDRLPPQRNWFPIQFVQILWNIPSTLRRKVKLEGGRRLKQST